MRIVGIVAEYDPFHNGHAYHLRATKARSGADYAVCVISTAFTQRGEAAFFAPMDRARMALAGGADAVFALPAAWAAREAETFALGGAAVLDGLGCDAISFGAESDDLSALRAAADLLAEEPPAFRAALAEGLADGLPYPAAAAAAASRCLPGAGELLAAPNNLLAVSYLRAMRKLGSAMTPIPVRREGDYHARELNPERPSATALRAALRGGGVEQALPAMPPACAEIAREALAAGRVCPPDALDQALRYRLLTMTEAEAAALPEGGEGMERLLLRAARTETTREGILHAAKTRRYPYARLSRACAHALLGMAAEAAADTPPAAWLLGFRREAAPLLTELKRRARLPLLAKAADWPAQDDPWFRTERRAYDLWSLGAGLPAGMAFTQGVAVYDGISHAGE